MKMAIVGAAMVVAVLAAGAAPTDPLAALAWMAGDWYGTDGPLEMEERWTEPRGGVMLGIHRDVKAGKAVSFEFFRVESTPQGITYFASPEGKPSTPFVVAELKGNRVVFENRKHDFPKRILYWLGDDGTLHARIEGDPGGKESAMEWSWKKGRFGG